MPDFERIHNQMRIDFAPTPEKKAWAKGYIRGKNIARFQILGVCVIVAAFAAVIQFHMQ